MDEITDNTNAEIAILLNIPDPSVDGWHYSIFDLQVHKETDNYPFDLKEAWELPLRSHSGGGPRQLFGRGEPTGLVPQGSQWQFPCLFEVAQVERFTRYG
jgi:hypothetical protein